MKGELGYKDIHGRVWRIHNRSPIRGWTAETLDVGHTEHASMRRWEFQELLSSIDREEYQIGRASQPIQSGEARDESDAARRESQPESIEEIRKHASEIDGHEFPLSDPGEGSTGREE